MVPAKCKVCKTYKYWRRTCLTCNESLCYDCVFQAEEIRRRVFDLLALWVCRKCKNRENEITQSATMARPAADSAPTPSKSTEQKPEVNSGAQQPPEETPEDKKVRRNSPNLAESCQVKKSDDDSERPGPSRPSMEHTGAIPKDKSYKSELSKLRSSSKKDKREFRENERPKSPSKPSSKVVKPRTEKSQKEFCPKHRLFWIFSQEIQKFGINPGCTTCCPTCSSDIAENAEFLDSLCSPENDFFRFYRKVGNRYERYAFTTRVCPNCSLWIYIKKHECSYSSSENDDECPNDSMSVEFCEKCCVWIQMLEPDVSGPYPISETLGLLVQRSKLARNRGERLEAGICAKTYLMAKEQKRAASGRSLKKTISGLSSAQSRKAESSGVRKGSSLSSLQSNETKSSRQTNNAASALPSESSELEKKDSLISPETSPLKENAVSKLHGSEKSKTQSSEVEKDVSSSTISSLPSLQSSKTESCRGTKKVALSLPSESSKLEKKISLISPETSLLKENVSSSLDKSKGKETILPSLQIEKPAYVALLPKKEFSGLQKLEKKTSELSTRKENAALPLSQRDNFEVKEEGPVSQTENSMAEISELKKETLSAVGDGSPEVEEKAFLSESGKSSSYLSECSNIEDAVISKPKNKFYKSVFSKLRLSAKANLKGSLTNLIESELESFRESSKSWQNIAQAFVNPTFSKDAEDCLLENGKSSSVNLPSEQKAKKKNFLKRIMKRNLKSKSSKIQDGMKEPSGDTLLDTNLPEVQKPEPPSDGEKSDKEPPKKIVYVTPCFPENKKTGDTPSNQKEKTTYATLLPPGTREEEKPKPKFPKNFGGGVSVTNPQPPVQTLVVNFKAPCGFCGILQPHFRVCTNCDRINLLFCKGIDCWNLRFRNAHAFDEVSFICQQCRPIPDLYNDKSTKQCYILEHESRDDRKGAPPIPSDPDELVGWLEDLEEMLAKIPDELPPPLNIPVYVRTSEEDYREALQRSVEAVVVAVERLGDDEEDEDLRGFLERRRESLEAELNNMAGRD